MFTIPLGKLEAAEWNHAVDLTAETFTDRERCLDEGLNCYPDADSVVRVAKIAGCGPRGRERYVGWIADDHDVAEEMISWLGHMINLTCDDRRCGAIRRVLRKLRAIFPVRVGG